MDTRKKRDLKLYLKNLLPVLLLIGVTVAASAMVYRDLTKKEERGVSISCGAVWAESCTDLERQLQQADRRMYEDKTRYYETHEKVR